MHDQYFEISAKNNHELGYKLGELFGANLQDLITQSRNDPKWESKVIRSKKYLDATRKYFPKYIEELEGYAKSADVKFIELWTLSLEDELYQEDKCTTLITNNGQLIGHNEDYKDAEEKVCILKKTVNNTTIFELYYLHTLGGNSISINSNGYIQAIDSLSQTDSRVGIPKNVIARWISETSSPTHDFAKLSKLQRASGFCHNLVDLKGETQVIESTATKERIDNITTPFVHSNHYLTDLSEYEANDNSTHTFERYESGKSRIKENMTVDEMKGVLEDTSRGPKASLFNERTIARMIVDTKEKWVYIWLGREKEKGWVKYNLNNIV